MEYGDRTKQIGQSQSGSTVEGGTAGTEGVGVPGAGGGIPADSCPHPAADEVQGDVAMKDEEIARSLQIGSATVERVRRRCVEEGVEAALGRREQLRRRPKKLDGSGEAHLIALACGEHRRDGQVGR